MNIILIFLFVFTPPLVFRRSEQYVQALCTITVHYLVQLSVLTFLPIFFIHVLSDTGLFTRRLEQHRFPNGDKFQAQFFECCSSSALDCCKRYVR